MEKITVLFVAANPEATSHLMLDEEVRAIGEKINAAALRDQVELVTAFATRSDDLLQALNQHHPHVLHFSGHGNASGELLLLNKYGKPAPVTPSAMLKVVAAVKHNLRLVVFNACNSEAHARAVTGVVDCAIGMTSLISDSAAVGFAAAFYRAVAFGSSIDEAFQQGKAALALDQIPDNQRPNLYERTGVDAKNLFLIPPQVSEGQDPLHFTHGDEHNFIAQVDLSKVKRLTVLSHTGRRIYDAIHQKLELLIQQHRDFPDEVRVLTRTPVVEGLYRNNYIRNTLAKARSLNLQGRNISVRLYESVPAFRGIMCEFHDQTRLTYLSTYAWLKPNMSKAFDHGFTVADTPANPHPMVAMLETWIDQYWGRDEIHTIVFDFDDTLVFSGEVQIKAWIQAVETALQRGLIGPEQLAESLHYDKDQPVSENLAMCQAIQEIFVTHQMAEAILKALFVGVNQATLDKINVLRYELREELMSQARTFKGVEAMLERLSAHHNFAIISSTDEQMIYDYLSQNRLLKYFPLILGKKDPSLAVQHENIHHKASLLIKLSTIIGIPLARMVYIGDNQTDYLATRQIGIPFIEARQAARLMGRKTLIPEVDPARPPIGYFDSYENDRLPEIIHAHSLDVSRKKYQM